MDWVSKISALFLVVLSRVVAIPVPRPAVNVRFVSPAHAFSSSYDTAATSHVSTILTDPESIWPVGVFLPPEQPLIIASTRRRIVDLEEDPFLITGQEASNYVKHLFGKGELFFEHVPHGKLILENQEDRRRNGLAGNRLGSNRPASPFYRWKTSRGRRQFKL